MDLVKILRDVVLPSMCLATLLGCGYFAYVLFALGHVGGGFCLVALSALISVFVAYDVKRLLG